MANRKFDKMIRDNPEAFDYADLPTPGVTAAQKAEADRIRPAWAKEMLAKRNAAT
jgi:hypothetical protein